MWSTTHNPRVCCEVGQMWITKHKPRVVQQPTANVTLHTQPLRSGQGQTLCRPNPFFYLVQSSCVQFHGPRTYSSGERCLTNVLLVLPSWQIYLPTYQSNSSFEISYGPGNRVRGKQTKQFLKRTAGAGCTIWPSGRHDHDQVRLKPGRGSGQRVNWLNPNQHRLKQAKLQIGLCTVASVCDRNGWVVV